MKSHPLIVHAQKNGIYLCYPMFSGLNSLLVDSDRFAVEIVSFGMKDSHHQYIKDISVYSC